MPGWGDRWECKRSKLTCQGTKSKLSNQCITSIVWISGNIIMKCHLSNAETLVGYLLNTTPTTSLLAAGITHSPWFSWKSQKKGQPTLPCSSSRGMRLKPAYGTDRKGCLAILKKDLPPLRTEACKDESSFLLLYMVVWRHEVLTVILD